MKLDMESYSMQTDKEIKVKGKFINRELSWIDFNRRVLDCTIGKIPLNERMNFLGITTSNLDEFLSVRFAYAYHNQKKEPYKEILKEIHHFVREEVNRYHHLCDELKDKGVLITKISKLDKKEIRRIRQTFHSFVFPLLTPIMINNERDLAYINSGDPCIAVVINQNGIDNLVVVPIPKDIDYIYEIGSKVVYVEDVVLNFLNELFINKSIKHSGIFRIIKDASICLDHDQNRFIVDRMNEIIQMRKTSDVIFMEIESEMSEELRDMLISKFHIHKSHVHTEKTITDFRRFSKTKLLPDKYSYKPFHPRIFGEAERDSLLSILDERDILLHHPYDSYETVVRFINHAATDPEVLAIKQTLYRVSSINSPIIKGLCKAAENGKQVTVLVEIKARFDEENNIQLINKLEDSGCRVILGTEYLKTHCKMCVVIRKSFGDYQIYSHIATGNYNEKTSRIYTDISYFTSKTKIGMDLLHVFNILSGISTPDSRLQKIAYSPVTLRKTLVNCIDREIEYAKKGKKAEIFIKVNSISDELMVKKLYEAADKGVDVYIIARGVCSIVPRKNIYIKSIVGRFLEHSRIYHFRNNGNAEYFISSADLLTRNLDRRIEIMLSLKDSNVIKKVQDIIRVLKKDEANSFEMTDKGNYKRIKGDYNSHEEFMKG